MSDGQCGHGHPLKFDMRFPSIPLKARNAMAAGGVVCSVIGGVVILKDSVGGGQYDKDAKQDDTSAGKKKYKETCKDKVYVVTGANSGIGKEIVTDLAHRGAKVYMACRDMRKCEEVRRDIVIDSRNKYVYCRMCDLSSLDSVRSFVDEFRAKEVRLDGLVNNAGVMNSPRAFSKEGSLCIHFTFDQKIRSTFFRRRNPFRSQPPRTLLGNGFYHMT